MGSRPFDPLRARELGRVLGVEVCRCTPIGERLVRLLEEALDVGLPTRTVRLEKLDNLVTLK